MPTSDERSTLTNTEALKIVKIRLFYSLCTAYNYNEMLIKHTMGNVFLILITALGAIVTVVDSAARQSGRYSDMQCGRDQFTNESEQTMRLDNYSVLITIAGFEPRTQDVINIRWGDDVAITRWNSSQYAAFKNGSLLAFSCVASNVWKSYSLWVKHDTLQVSYSASQADSSFIFDWLSGIQVFPQRLLAQMGTAVRFNCSTTNGEPVYWSRKPHGSNDEQEFYIGEKRLGLLQGYERFSVEVDSTGRRHDLVIKDLKQTDAGVYICTEKRGFGEKAYAELVVWDELTCQEDQIRESYMGENVFGLDQDIMSFTCRMKYMGNTLPEVFWPVGGKKLLGTQRTDSENASSSLTLVATIKYDGVNVTFDAYDRNSIDVLWTSKTIRVKYAVWKKRGAKECPGFEYVLDCNPPCSYKLETVNGTERCAVGYSVGSDVKWYYIEDKGSTYLIGMIVLAAVSGFLLITLTIRCFKKKLCFGRPNQQHVDEEYPLGPTETLSTADRDALNASNQHTGEEI